MYLAFHGFHYSTKIILSLYFYLAITKSQLCLEIRKALTNRLHNTHLFPFLVSI